MAIAAPANAGDPLAAFLNGIGQGMGRAMAQQQRHYNAPQGQYPYHHYRPARVRMCGAVDPWGRFYWRQCPRRQQQYYRYVQ